MTLTILQERVALCDPQDCTDRADALSLLEAIFAGLIRRQSNGRFAPCLAEGWTVAAEGRLWRFDLKPGLTFHNGDPIDAEVVRASIARMQRPDVGATLGAPAVWGQYLIGARIEATEPLTLEIETVEPMADLLDILVSGYILPPDLVDRPDFLARPIGAGPYRATETGPGFLALEAFEGWAGRPRRHGAFRFVEMAEAGDRLAAVAAGEADLTTRLDPTMAAPSGVDLKPYMDPVAIIYLLNAASGPCADPRIRRALNLAIDRATVIDRVLDGAGTPLTGFISQQHFGAGDPGDAAADLAGARALLAEAGHGAGLTLRVDCPTSLPDEAEALTAEVARQLAAVGVTLDVTIHADRTAYAEMVQAKGIGDLCVFDSSPQSAFRVIAEKLDGRRDGAWRQGYGDATVEALLDQARVTIEEDAREAVYRQAYARLQENPAWLPLYTRTRALAARPGVLRDGWTMRADGVLDIAAF